MSARFDYDTILELSRSGWSLAEVAGRVGCTKRTVSRVRKLGGVSGPSRWRRVTPELIEAARAMVDDGASWAEIQRTLRVGEHTLQKYLPGTAWSKTQVAEFSVAVRSAGVRL